MSQPQREHRLQQIIEGGWVLGNLRNGTRRETPLEEPIDVLEDGLATSVQVQREDALPRPPKSRSTLLPFLEKPCSPDLVQQQELERMVLPGVTPQSDELKARFALGTDPENPFINRS